MRFAKTGYIHYLVNPEQHTNTAGSHAGFGRTPQEAQYNSQYWANQRCFCRTVRLMDAPQWAIEEANRE
jgi:hypothetical protein